MRFISKCDIFAGVIGKSFKRRRIELAVWAYLGGLKATLLYLNCELVIMTGGQTAQLHLLHHLIFLKKNFAYFLTLMSSSGNAKAQQNSDG
jgi:sterol desaturase/sphingolipid hydroxylase (fatty acid hydroxylase superfamily)